jgi:hypothetical protein
MSHYRDTLWVALSAALDGDAGSWLQERRSAGLSWRDIEAECAEVGVPVSHEWLRSQAKARGLDRKVA